MLDTEFTSLMLRQTIRPLCLCAALCTAVAMPERPASAAQSASQPAQPDNPDALYRNRENLPSAERAADGWQARASADFDSAWKLARVCYWLGTHGAKESRRAALERGVKAGESAVLLSPNRPEGHFWMAADMGMLAESFGLSQGLKYRGRIRAELERTIAIDATWDEGSAEAALGEWYATVPGLFGGDKKKAEEHLRRAVAINAESRTALIDLAELLIDQGRTSEARPLLRRAVDAPIDPDWAPEDRADARHAADLLATLGQ
jgi:tetratricopeptide (TPR) repeat protein